MQNERGILFYQANFEPEVFRMLDALEKGDDKHFQFFKKKTLNIVNLILSMSNRNVEKEEWFAVKNLVDGAEYTTEQMRSLLRSYGNPFSNKYARQMQQQLS